MIKGYGTKKMHSEQEKKSHRVKIRLKKLIFTLLLIIYISLYSLLIVTFADKYILNLHAIIQLFFFIIAGFVWIYPAKILLLGIAKK